ncbi:MAG: hypothetical protein DHS20C09_07260 [marine bacterium B5-7]|nr:MAG: hypothetical protein DHS20C09_07260 [marine bacterium B5-7]
MENISHAMSDLFAQLGLPNSNSEIDHFVNTHRPVPDDVTLEKALFWNNGQAQFIHEALYDDSDWTELVDQLDTRLRG